MEQFDFWAQKLNNEWDSAFRQKVDLMTKRIVHVGKGQRLLRIKPSTMQNISPDQIATALGGTRAEVEIERPASPLLMTALRQELALRLQSSGGRPALCDTDKRAKIPVSDEDWQRLEDIAAKLTSSGLAPTAGQVASTLLRLAIREVTGSIAEA